MKADEIDWTCNTLCPQNRTAHNFRHLDVGGKVIVRYILRKWGVCVWIGSAWLLAQDRVQWQGFVSTVINLLVP